MQSRRFIAEDMRQALKKVRDVLGPDAIILSNRRVPGGIEVTASLEPTSKGQSGAGTAKEAGLTDQPVEDQDSVFARMLNAHQTQAATTRADDELVATLRSEIESLRLLLKDQMSEQRQTNWDMSHPVMATVRRRLEQLGLSKSVVDEALVPVSQHRTIEDGWQSSLAWLGAQIQIPDQELLVAGGCFSFVGAAGAGKTTTLAKLAVRFALRHGRDNLALVTTDHQRMGSFEQLRSLGRILGIDVHVADQQQTLSSILRRLENKKLVLVDTGGLPQDLEKCAAELAPLRLCRQLKNLMVLPATSQASVLSKSLARLGDLALAGCIISKVDEADSLGEVLSLVVENKLPVAYITHGPAIPEDIKLARAEALVNRLQASAGKERYSDRQSPLAAFQSGPSQPGRRSLPSSELATAQP